MAHTPAHILVVDDDTRLRELLRKYLFDHGYLVTSATSSMDAQEKLNTIQVDLMVLDVMMPGEDGMAFTARLRAQQGHKNLPILLLTAKGEPADRIQGLEAGSDDYLMKPFEPRELLLRVQAILRRAPKDDKKKEIWFGHWLFDAERAELRDGDRCVRLTEAEHSLLNVLAAAPGDIISREELVARSPVPINDRTIDVQVTRLRRKIETDPRQPRYLTTVRGGGYRLMPEKTT